jgi:hypothetical protein
METIIGLGSAGCRIADKFTSYPQYEVYKIDSKIKGENTFSLGTFQTPEEYEKNVPDMCEFLKNISGDVLFIVSGGGKVSGALLQIMKQLKNCAIHVAYIKPDNNSLTKNNMLHEKVVFNVVQEYARSGLFKRVFLFDNALIENLIGDVPIMEYNDRLNDIIVTAIHYLNVFVNTEPVLNNYDPPKETQRICTLGILDLENNIENPFFSLDFVGNKCYYFSVPEQTLKTDGKLFKTIKEKIGSSGASYQVHSSKHNKIFVYFIENSSKIQNE